MKTILGIPARQSANNWPSTTRDFAQHFRKLKLRIFGTNSSTKGSRYGPACFNSNSRLQR